MALLILAVLSDLPNPGSEAGLRVADIRGPIPGCRPGGGLCTELDYRMRLEGSAPPAGRLWGLAIQRIDIPDQRLRWHLVAHARSPGVYELFTLRATPGARYRVRTFLADAARYDELDYRFPIAAPNPARSSWRGAPQEIVFPGMPCPGVSYGGGHLPPSPPPDPKVDDAPSRPRSLASWAGMAAAIVAAAFLCILQTSRNRDTSRLGG